MTGIIRIGVTERGVFKNYSEPVHIPQRLCITSYSEITVHLQNQLKARFCIDKGWVIARRAFFLLCTSYEMNDFEMTLLV